MKKIGIIGCGNVATEILKTDIGDYVREVCLFDIDEEKTYNLAELFHSRYNFVICNSVKELVKESDIIVESASVNAVKSLLQELTKFPEKKVLILSVGGVIRNFQLYKKLIQKNYKIYIPSGAIVGCDGLSALTNSGIKKIILRTTKPTESLLSAPYFKQNKSIYKKVLSSKKTVVFRGNVYDAIKYFPQNINVAATLAVISHQPQKVEVELVAQKGLKKNIHEVTIISDAGKIYTKTENVPSVSNPKTSYLAALSLIYNLKMLLKE